MEWHGEKMIPNGLPELIHQVTPNWIRQQSKVIVYSRLPKSIGDERRLRGRTYPNGRWQIIELFPTNILLDYKGPGVTSFNYWLHFLDVLLRQVGQIATEEKLVGRFSYERYNSDFSYRDYIEAWAAVWKNMTKDVIASRDPRVGQPLGWIRGLAGIYIIRNTKMTLNSHGAQYCGKDLRRIQDIRAYKCRGQFTLTNVLSNFANMYLPKLDNKVPRFMRRLRRYAKKTAAKIGIKRSYTDTAGRKHLFFNYGEAMAMTDQLRRYVLENDLIEVAVRESLNYDRLLQDSQYRLINGPKISSPQPTLKMICRYHNQ